jgi:hypothetical protein
MLSLPFTIFVSVKVMQTLKDQYKSNKPFAKFAQSFAKKSLCSGLQFKALK